MSLRLHRTFVDRCMLIAGTDLTVERIERNRVPAGYELGALTATAEAWCDAAGLTGTRFARRCDLLAAVAAHAALSPLPAEQDPLPDLRRIGPGHQRTVCGRFEIRRPGPGETFYPGRPGHNPHTMWQWQTWDMRHQPPRPLGHSITVRDGAQRIRAALDPARSRGV